jgi:hypothetical protein
MEWIVVPVLLGILFKAVVPADNAELGTLEELDAKRQHGDPPLSYPKNFFGTSRFALLPAGKTHYFMIGPEKGERVVLVHGITVFSAFYEFIYKTCKNRLAGALCLILYII